MSRADLVNAYAPGLDGEVELVRDPQFRYTVGVSDANIRNSVVGLIVNTLRPRVVLDLGCGSGTYGAMIKQAAPDVQMIGVDGFLKYLSSAFNQMFYDVRMHAEIGAFLGSRIDVGQDLTLLMDVIEHFEKSEAVTLIGMLPVPFIVSTPLFEYAQGSVGGNDLEEHKCWFSRDELLELGLDELFVYPHDERGDIGAFGRFPE